MWLAVDAFLGAPPFWSGRERRQQNTQGQPPPKGQLQARCFSAWWGRADSVGTYGAPKFRTGLRFAGQRKMLTGQMNHENLIELIDEVRLGVGRFAARGGMGRNGFRFGS